MAADLMGCIDFAQPWGRSRIGADRRVTVCLKDRTARCKSAAILGALKIKHPPVVFEIHIQFFGRLVIFFVNQ